MRKDNEWDTWKELTKNGPLPLVSLAYLVAVYTVHSLCTNIQCFIPEFLVVTTGIILVIWLMKKYHETTLRINREKTAQTTIKLMEKYFSPLILDFFKALERRGILTLSEIEKQLFDNLSLAFLVIERGEALDKIDKRLKYIISNILDQKNPTQYRPFPSISTIFRHFMLSVVSEWDTIDKVIPFNPSPGFSLFLVIPRKNSKNLEDKIIEEYRNYVAHLYESVQNDPNIEETHKKIFTRWFNEFSPPSNPIIIVAYPYQTTIDVLLERLPTVSGATEEYIKFILESKILRQSLEIGNIKLAYLFEAARYNESIVNKLIKLDKRLKMKLGNGSQITLTEFIGLLHPYNRLLTSVQSIDPQLYNEIISNTGPLANLRRLINDLRLAMYGVQPQGEMV
ncbi:hypothetical protein PAP_05220 [Palaeococcus pacificus DY20341]|uniref:Uncharacterized protein n=1 Tax=Palaeococcus pacificus DY20341 TaxID=1343739 RepID=A0A075LRS1_9EURY|nr:hypothetical protein [Palaeococcus pacificus]AIF69455.1 hypothetical protein PAP_05220 [Palaeococcus pacificus DY20341]